MSLGGRQGSQYIPSKLGLVPFLHLPSSPLPNIQPGVCERAVSSPGEVRGAEPCRQRILLYFKLQNGGW